MDEIDDGMEQTLKDQFPEMMKEKMPKVGLTEQHFEKMMESWQKQADLMGEDKEIGVEDLMG